MRNRFTILTIFMLSSFCMVAQESVKKNKKEKKGYFYFAGGSHRIFYTPGDIHVIRKEDPGFDFTLKKVKAGDEGGLKFETAPQFSYTIGYYFRKKKFGLEYHYDHIKYFVRSGQRVHLKGVIDNMAYDKDTTITDDFFRLEHSDGGNYAMINFVKWVPLPHKKWKNPPEVLMKAGVGLVNPKTNSSIVGNIRDDKYHISGYVIGIESGLRIHFGNYLFATGSFKGAYANYSHFLIAGGYGKQMWVSGQFNYMIGAQFPL